MTKVDPVPAPEIGVPLKNQVCVAFGACVSNVISLPPHSALPAAKVISSPKSPPKLKLPASINIAVSKRLSP